MTTREAIHHLVDDLADDDLATAERLLLGLRITADPVLRSLAMAPIDDEPETEEERAAVAEAMAEADGGDVVTLEEVEREFGLR